MSKINELVSRLVVNDAEKSEHMNRHISLLARNAPGCDIHASNMEWDRLQDQCSSIVAGLVVEGRVTVAHDTVRCPPPSAHDMAHDAIDTCERVLASSRRMRAAGVAR
jgi:hypothetical protein